MLKVETSSTLRSMIFKAEKSDDEHEQAGIALNFTSLMPAADARPLLTKSEDGQRFARLIDGLWDEDGDLNIFGMRKMSFDTDISNVECRLQPEFVEETNFVKCKVNGVTVKPEANKTMLVSFKVQTHPREGDLDLLSKLILKDMAVRLVQQQEEMDV